MALVVNGTSWVGFGWRPRSLTAECRKFPTIVDFNAASSSAVAEPAPETSSEPAPETSSEPSSEPSSEVTAEPKSEPEPESASAEPKSEPEPESSSEPSSEVTAEPKTPKPSSEPASEVTAEPRPLEPLALGSYKSSRISSARALPSSKQKQSDEYTVSTSVSYRVSSVAGRRKRAAQKGNFSTLS